MTTTARKPRRKRIYKKRPYKKQIKKPNLVPARYLALTRSNFEVSLFEKLYTIPLARDPRVNHNWQHSPIPYLKYTAALIGGGVTQLEWHLLMTNKLLGREARSFIRLEPRAPTAICTNVLFTLLRLALEGKTNVIEMDWPEFAKELGVVANNFYMFATWDAVRLWQQLGIQWEGLPLPPPVTTATCKIAKRYYALAGTDVNGKRLEGDHSFRLTISQEWLDLCLQATGKPIRLPVPMQATPQNIVLSTWHHGSTRILNNPWFYSISGNKHGLDVTPWVPIESFVVASAWYGKIGGYMDYQREPFTLHPSGKSYKPSQHIQTRVVYPKNKPVKVKNK